VKPVIVLMSACSHTVNNFYESFDAMVYLKAGPTDKTWKTEMPAALMYLLKNPKYSWCYETEPQPNMNNRRLFWPRGKVVELVV